MSIGTARAAADFPAADAGFHNDAETRAQIDAVVAAHPAIASRTTIGTSYEGRELWAVKLSDNVAVDEGEPEVLFIAGQHAREHLTIEMALYLIDELTSRYATDARIKGIVDSREIWIVPNLNPDGSEYDIATGTYRSWRKNRQPNAGSDVRRHRPQPQLGLPAGAAAAAPAASLASRPTAARRRSRPRRRRRCATSSTAASSAACSRSRPRSTSTPTRELVLWPYGYTHRNVADGHDRDDQATRSRRSARAWPRTNGYTPEQASDLYITDGTIDDWLWGANGIFAFTFEMYPGASGARLLPARRGDHRETQRNREAVLLLLESAACPYARDRQGGAALPRARR